jgi:hypothetical protein
MQAARLRFSDQSLLPISLQKGIVRQLPHALMERTCSRYAAALQKK